MAKKLFLAATGQHQGKTAMSVCLVHLAQRKGYRVGYLKPVGQQHLRLGAQDVDKDVALIATQFGLTGDLEHMSPVVVKQDVTRRHIDGELPTRELAERIVEAAAALERRCDVLVIEGTGHGGVGSVLGLNNAQVARLLGAPVAIVSGGGIGKTVDAVALNHALYREEGVRVGGVIVNKLLPDKREGTLDYVRRALASRGLAALGGLDYSPLLANPTLAHVARLFGVALHGAPAAAANVAYTVQLGAASTQRVVDLLEPGTLLIVNSTREEVLVTTASLYRLPEFRPRLAGLVVSCRPPVPPIAQRLLDDAGIPYARVEQPAAHIFRTLHDYVSKLSPDDHEKLAHLKAQAELTLDFDAVERMLGLG